MKKNNFIKKIILLICVTIISVLFSSNYSFAISWVESKAYTRVVKTQNRYKYFKAYCMLPLSSGGYTYGESWLKEPSRQLVDNKWVYKMGELNVARPTWYDYNTFCIQHDENVSEDSSNTTYLSRYKITIENRKVQTAGYGSYSSEQGNADGITNAAAICYIFSHGKLDTSNKTKASPLQWAMWKHTNAFFKSMGDKDIIKDVAGGLSKNIDSAKDNKENEYYEWLNTGTNYADSKKLIEESAAYETYRVSYESFLSANNNNSVVDLTISSDIKSKKSENNYIIGPFKISYASGSYNNKFFGGIDVDACKLTYGSNNTEIGKNLWEFCNNAGTALTGMPSNNTDFYIKFKTELSSYANNLKLHIVEKHLDCEAQLYDLTSGSAEQEWVFSEYGKTYYNTSKINIDVPTFGKIKILKRDSQSKKGLPRAVFEVKQGTTVVATLTTGADGKATTDFLQLGTYKVSEKTAPANYLKSNEEKEVTLDTPGETKDVEPFDNIPLGKISVKKIDSQTKDGLSGVVFSVKKNKTEVEKITTNKDGEATSGWLELGTYTVEEIAPPENYQKIDGEVEANLTKVGETVSVGPFENIPYGSLEILKKDIDTKEKLDGIKFVIKNAKGYYLTKTPSDGVALFESKKIDKAKEFVTGTDGKIYIEKIEVGSYTIQEVSVGKNWQYEVKSEPDEKEIEKGTNTTIIYNQRMYMNLTGYVWEDIGQGKDNLKNNIYESKTTDKKVENVKVILKNKDGEVVKNKDNNDCVAITNSKGIYKFSAVRIDEIKNYHVEFEYNGMSYKSITKNMDIENGNKASDVDRTTFNSNFERVEYNTVYKGKQEKEIKYEKDGYTSKLLYGTNEKGNNVVYGYKGANYPINGQDADINNLNELFRMTAKTTTLNKIKSKANGVLKKMTLLTPKVIRKNKIDTMNGINLGIKEREQPNLSLIKDLDTVKIQVNGSNYQHVYKYGNRKTYERLDIATKKWDETTNTYIVKVKGQDKWVTYADANGNPIKEGLNDGFSIGVKTQDKYGGMTYVRTVYKADVEYQPGDITKELQVYATYKISISNSSSNIYSRVNKIVEYYDKKYEFDGIGTKMNEDGTLTGTWVSNSKETIQGDSYKKKEINIPDDKNMVSHETNNVYYVRLKLNREAILQTVQDDNDFVKNIVEISSYTSYSDKGGTKLYGGIDKNSQPGNLNPEDTSTYEDDSEAAPGLQICYSEPRSLTGIVFEDGTGSENINSGSERKGDSKYDSNTEEGIGKVKVKFSPRQEETSKYVIKTETVSKDDNYYIRKETSGNIINLIPETNRLEDKEYITKQYLKVGEYFIGGFIPDEYEITYTWGDKDHPVQNYKGAIYNQERYNRNKSDAEWYKKDSTIRYTDALDKYTKRQEIDNEINYGNQINELYQKFQDTYNEGSGIAEEDKLKTKMDSTTLPFKVGLEYVNNTTDTNNEYKIENNNIKKDEFGNVQKGENDVHKITNIDFGITLRPRQEIRLEKRVSEIKVVSPSKDTLVEAKIGTDEHGNRVLQTTSENVIYLAPSEVNKGILKVELDNEVIQGATLYLKYELVVTNISEKDYNTQDFYLFGIAGSNNELVTIRPMTIIDYLGDGISTGEEAVKWTPINGQNRQDLFSGGLLSESMKNDIMAETVLVNYRNILDETRTLKPNESIATEMQTSKLLTTTEEISMKNDAEVIVSKKSGGSMLVSTPGNYNPANSEQTHENDDSCAEDSTVTPPTGISGISHTIYISISIVILGIMAISIVIIKKKNKK